MVIKNPLVIDRWSLHIIFCHWKFFSLLEIGHKIRFMVRKLGHKTCKRGHFITIFLQNENICKMVRKVINNLLFRQGSLMYRASLTTCLYRCLQFSKLLREICKEGFVFFIDFRIIPSTYP